MAFKHWISFATDLAANFGCNWVRIMPNIVSRLLLTANWSCCAVLFESEQTPFSLTSSWFKPTALHRICSYVIFLLRDPSMIEKLIKGMGTAMVGNNFLPIPLKCSYHMKKNCLDAAQNLQSNKTLLTLELSQYSYFPQLSQSPPAATAALNTLCLCLPV